MAKDINDSLKDIQETISDVSDLIHKIDKDQAVQQHAFETHLKHFESMHQELKRMNDILQSNTESLKEHMRRTEILEDIIQKMDQRFSPIELDHIKKNAVHQWRKDKIILGAKIIGAFATGIGILAAAKPYLIKLLMM